MKLAIVGSTQIDWTTVPVELRQALLNTINALLQEYQPTHIVSGGAVGIDTLAEHIAQAVGITPVIFLPAKPRWFDGYKPRNEKIAQTCDVLVRFALKNVTTYGSGWTRDRAKALGKPTRNFVVDVAAGTVIENNDV